MLVHTKGIVFRSIKYGDNALVVKIFTEELGIQSYMVKGIRSRRSKTKPSFFEPLTLLEIEADQKPNRQLQHLKEVRVAHAWQHIPFSVEKQSILLFLNEILYKSIREEVPDRELFSWLFHSLIWFDLEETRFINFHLLFLVRLTRFLGFYPEVSALQEQEVRYFDLQNGNFSIHQPAHSYFSEGHLVQKFFRLVHSDKESVKTLTLTTAERRFILDLLLSYYQIHLPGLGNIQSVEVLRMVLHPENLSKNTGS